ncbi:hypothetical protein Xbed_00011 [Xenorhabdus beddingii]|uniref:Uncharacterized protein n=1 Tax=Xenorhabdus beddingii TaxID=40578 RepID=A0A1Y2SRT7_9GAMM|nr:hypothetical protein [Xenorhabdus beddingii]OTA21765.1 hypothetical protein Xbed_00011 [Xenorhabdus beddingii]
MVKEKLLNAKGLFLLFIDHTFVVGLLRYASQLVDIFGDAAVADDEKQVGIVDNPV